MNHVKMALCVALIPSWFWRDMMLLCDIYAKRERIARAHTPVPLAHSSSAPRRACLPAWHCHHKLLGSHLDLWRAPAAINSNGRATVCRRCCMHSAPLRRGDMVADRRVNWVSLPQDWKKRSCYCYFPDKERQETTVWFVKIVKRIL